MKKFSKYKKVEEIQNVELHMLCEELLHVGIEGPIEPLLIGKLTIEGKEELVESLKNHIDLLVKEKIRATLEEAKNRAVSGDLRWFDQKIANTYDTI